MINLFKGSDESGDSTQSPDVGVSDGHVVQDLHHAQPIQLGKDTVTLESYGICAVSLYDYQVIQLVMKFLFCLIIAKGNFLRWSKLCVLYFRRATKLRYPLILEQDEPIPVKEQESF